MFCCETIDFSFIYFLLHCPFSLIFWWPCISIYLFINIKQLDALNFIVSLFQASICLEHMCSSSGGQKLYYTVSGIITPIGGRPVHRLRDTRDCDDTRDCIIQFCSHDDEHLCSKHVEAWNKLIIKFSASSWLILINKYIEMHGKQNIKIPKICYMFRLLSSHP